MNLFNSIFLLSFCLSLSTVHADIKIKIDAQKDSFYGQLSNTDQGYLHISHSEFLPFCGPMPEDNTDLSANVWMAWDSTYFYFYTEVQDNIIRVNNDMRQLNDCLELKFDPDPTQKPLSGIVNARLTALDSTEADNIQGVDNLYPEVVSENLDSAAISPTNYARRLTVDGYVLELRLAWKWIKADDRNVHVGIGNIFGLAINFHDNDSEQRDGSIQWSAGMADEVWTMPALLGTAELLEDNQIRLIRKNAIDPNARPSMSYLSSEWLNKRTGKALVIENWLYHPGDNPDFAAENYNDNDWELIHPLMTKDRMPVNKWKGIGWFRTHIVVDSSLWGKPLRFVFDQAGAVEIYLDGDSLYQFGKVGTSIADEDPLVERNPRYIVFKDKMHHVLAVRYSNFDWQGFHEGERAAGFICLLDRNLLSMIDNRVKMVRDFSIFQIAFTVIPLVLMVMHFLLFVFYRNNKENLYFAICMLCWAFIAYVDFISPFFTRFSELYIFVRIHGFAVPLAIIFGLLTIYTGIYGRIPKRIYLFYLIAAGIVIWQFISFRGIALSITLYSFIALTALEIFRLVIFPGLRGKPIRRATLIGFSLFMLALIYQMLFNLQILPRIGEYGIAYVYGLLALSISVSIDLSLNFARTHKNLERQLIQVRDLSEKTLYQERQMRQEEIQRKLLEADNTRKTRELEEARNLQLSMLPRKIPTPKNLDIAAKMITANEVGGDYYDFYLGDDGTFTVAIGDATGHGMRAGTMVTSVKSLFAAFGDQPDIAAFFNRCTDIIKDMNMGNIFMGMMLVKLNCRTMTAASAGMPPILIHRGTNGHVDELVMKGMPLGASRDFKYKQKNAEIYPGDTILLLTDGLPELFNREKEMLDYPRLKKKFGEVANKPANEIITELVNMGHDWRQDEPLADDCTFVVIKVKNN
jgi:serine phosphatase RsbU (regulator of sigma subunit)